MRIPLTRKAIALIGLIIGIIGLFVTIEYYRASIDYWLEKRETFVVGLNSITIYCKNGGKLDGDFKLKLRFVNASFSNQTTKPYTQVDNSTVKIRFLLHEDESNQKTVYFTIHEKVNGFSIKLSAGKTNFFGVEKLNPMYPTKLEYKWNEQENIFVLIE